MKLSHQANRRPDERPHHQQSSWSRRDLRHSRSCRKPKVKHVGSKQRTGLIHVPTNADIQHINSSRGRAMNAIRALLTAGAANRRTGR